jgi:hypothetical protein
LWLQARFEYQDPRSGIVYQTPVGEAGNAWSEPGPAAGPIEVQLADGSILEYHW